MEFENIFYNLTNSCKQKNIFFVTGIELEFYSENIQKIRQNFPYINFVKEKGLNQFEAIFQYDKVENVVKQFLEFVTNNQVKENINLYSGNQPNCGLHVHVNIADYENNNLYSTNINKLACNQNLWGDVQNKMLLNSIAGLLTHAKSSQDLMFNNETDLKRLKNQDLKHNFTPNKICWGGNNRSTMLRVLEINSKNCRIEHRLAHASSNIYSVLSAIIASITDGIDNNLLPPPRIWGNAFDPQYQLEEFSTNFEEIRTNFEQSKIKDILATYL